MAAFAALSSDLHLGERCLLTDPFAAAFWALALTTMPRKMPEPEPEPEPAVARPPDPFKQAVAALKAAAAAQQHLDTVRGVEDDLWPRRPGREEVSVGGMMGIGLRGGVGGVV